MNSEAVKKMAEVLKAGGDILSEICPNCKVPLVRVGGSVFCPVCNTRFLLVSSDEAAGLAQLEVTLNALISVAESRIRELVSALSMLSNPDEEDRIIRKMGKYLKLVESALRVREELEGERAERSKQ